jgi:hypothetical protein
VAGAITLVALFALSLIYMLPVILLALLAGGSLAYDPKLVILVEDGRGGTGWISLFTWYD